MPQFDLFTWFSIAFATVVALILFSLFVQQSTIAPFAILQKTLIKLYTLLRTSRKADSLNVLVRSYFSGLENNPNNKNEHYLNNNDSSSFKNNGHADTNLAFKGDRTTIKHTVTQIFKRRNNFKTLNDTPEIINDTPETVEVKQEGPTKKQKKVATSTIDNQKNTVANSSKKTPSTPKNKKK